MLAYIGSRALRYCGYDAVKPKDFDIVGSYKDIQAYVKEFCEAGREVIAEYPEKNGKKLIVKFNDDTIFDCEIAWPGSTAADLLYIICADPKSVVIKHDLLAASIDVQYLLKMSHRYLKNSPHFLKTMRHIKFLRFAGAKIRENHNDFYVKRMKETYDYGLPKLNTDKKSFFNVKDSFYVYDHDWLHEVVKVLDVPAYTKYSDGEVWSSKEKFEKCSEDVKICGVYEEACVLALERSQIPHPEVHPDKSFAMALEKVCTSITSGFFREYAWENYYTVMGFYNKSPYNQYKEMFDEQVRLGNVVMFKQ